MNLSPQTLSGPAYGRGMRFLSSLLVLGLGLLLARVIWRTDGWASSDAIWLIGLSGMAVAASWWQMITSTTTIDAQGIRQSGWVEKAMRWDEISAARLVGSRLILKARFGRPRVFFAGNAELAAAFRQIASTLHQG